MKIIKKNSIALPILFIIFFNFSFTNAANHDFTGLPITSDGWTDFETITSSGYESSRVIFVSPNGTTGQDYNIGDVTFDADGMFQPTGIVNAYPTVAEGYARLRDGFPDILLIEKGSVWSGSFGPKLTKSGLSLSDRQIIATYGLGARPRFNLSATSGPGLRAGVANNIIFSGIHFQAPNDIVERGIEVLGEGSNHLFEDCELGFVGNLVQGYPSYAYENWLSGIAFRRNIFNDRPRGTKGLFLTGYKIDKYLVEENVFWLSDEIVPTEERRILYFETGDVTQNQTIVKGNIFFRPDSGVHLRSGGTFDNNLLVKVNQLLVGGHGGNGGTIHSATITNNVWAGSNADAESNGALLMHNMDGSTVSGNIWTGVVDHSGGMAAMSVTGTEGVYVFNNTTISDNIMYNWGPGATNGLGLRISELLTAQNNTITGNDFQFNLGSEKLIYHLAPTFDGYSYSNNRYHSSTVETSWLRAIQSNVNVAGWAYASGEAGAQAVQVSYPVPDRSLATYNTLLGGNSSTEEFMLETLEQSRQNWRPAYTACATNNYVRAGFGKEEIPCWTTTVIRSDVDGSSEITTTDALLTLRNSLGLSMNGTAWRASATTGDVNCDGVSNSTDALLILRHSLGLSMSGTGWCEDIN